MQFAVDADGTRQSAFRAYLPKAIANDPAHRLHICTRAIAGKLEFSAQSSGHLRAESVEVHSVDGRHVRVIKARREIVLTSGALGTPKILLLRFVRLNHRRKLSSPFII
jgi:choline dehydrogenase